MEKEADDGVSSLARVKAPTFCPFSPFSLRPLVVPGWLVAAVLVLHQPLPHFRLRRAPPVLSAFQKRRANNAYTARTVFNIPRTRPTDRPSVITFEMNSRVEYRLESRRSSPFPSSLPLSLSSKFPPTEFPPARVYRPPPTPIRRPINFLVQNFEKR